MKKKIIAGILLTGALAATIAGGTMAWFTDDAVLAAADFKAGTVVINAEEPTLVPMQGKFVDNVNPGDCATVIWEITNDGTKAAELRVQLSDEWAEGLPLANVHYSPAPDSGWATYTDNAGTWFYYTGGPIAGTYIDGETLATPEMVELPVVVAFDGIETDNKYQGKSYKLSGNAEAVQASNGAPDAVWADAWTEVTVNGINQVNQYFITGPGKDMPCWKKEGSEDTEEPGEPGEPQEPGEEEPAVEKHTVNIDYPSGLSVTGAGEYTEGATVTVALASGDAQRFKGWEKNGEIVSEEVSYTFVMGTEDVTLKAVEKVIKKHKVKIKSNSSLKVTGAGEYEEGDTVTVKAETNLINWFSHWEKNGKYVSGNKKYTFKMGAKDVNLKAVYY